MNEKPKDIYIRKLDAIERRLSALSTFFLGRLHWAIGFYLGFLVGLSLTVLIVGPHACFKWAQEVLSR